VLARLDGDVDEKRLWLEHEGPRIEAASGGNKGKVAGVTVRFYRSYLAGERRWRDEAKARRAVATSDRLRARGLIGADGSIDPRCIDPSGRIFEPPEAAEA
jgi:hypothetical protein